MNLDRQLANKIIKINYICLRIRAWDSKIQRQLILKLIYYFCIGWREWQMQLAEDFPQSFKPWIMPHPSQLQTPLL